MVLPWCRRMLMLLALEAHDSSTEFAHEMPTLHSFEALVAVER